MAATLPFSSGASRSHAIFVPPASSSTDDGWEVVDSPQDDGLPAPKNSRIALRDKDIIVAFGKEIRMTSLTGPGWEINGGTVGGYKTLKSPHLTFNIHSLVSNPTGRSLAVVGHHQLVILVLPRSGFASSVGGDIACHSFPIDEYQHSPSSDNAITKVRWHEWGESGNSLWVLTADGQLFEYDVLRPQDPVQSFNFLADRSKGSKFSAIDPSSQYATSFSFSHGTVDFGPLMVYALMANGDVYVMGPVLPSHAEVPAAYLQSSQAWATERQKRLKDDGKHGAEHASLLGRAGSQVQWVDASMRQAEKKDEEPSPEQPRKHRRGFGSRDPSPERTPERTPPRPGFVHVHPPHSTPSGSPAPGVHRPSLRQGPVSFGPAPQEVGNGDEIDEQIASDIVVFPAVPAEVDSSPSEDAQPINVVGIAWSGGRIDIGVEEVAPEPRWLSSRDPVDAEIVVPIVESVLASYPPVEPEALAINAPRFVADPIHRDVFYVQSAFSVDTVSVAPWIGKSNGGSGDSPPSDVAALVIASPTKPIIGTATFCNITSGYGLIALAAGGQLVAVEMDMRVADRDPQPVPEPEKPKPAEESHQSSTKAFNPASDSKTANPLAAVRKLPDSRKESKEIGPQHSRALADAAAQVNKQAEAIRNASAKVEARVESQAQEYQRQSTLLRESQTASQSIQAETDEQAERTERLVDEQAALSARLDAVSNAMLAEYRPQIGEVERKWFDESERIKARISGRKGIAHRAKILNEQLDVVRPSAQRRKEQHEAAYGHRQLKPLEHALSERSDELARIMRRMETLSMRVEGADEE